MVSHRLAPQAFGLLRCGGICYDPRPNQGMGRQESHADHRVAAGTKNCSVRREVGSHLRLHGDLPFGWMCLPLEDETTASRRVHCPPRPARDSQRLPHRGEPTLAGRAGCPADRLTGPVAPDPLGRADPHLLVLQPGRVPRVRAVATSDVSHSAGFFPGDRCSAGGLCPMGRPHRRRPPARGDPRLPALDGREPARLARRGLGQVCRGPARAAWDKPGVSRENRRAVAHQSLGAGPGPARKLGPGKRSDAGPIRRIMGVGAFPLGDAAGAGRRALPVSCRAARQGRGGAAFREARATRPRSRASLDGAPSRPRPGSRHFERRRVATARSE